MVLKLYLYLSKKSQLRSDQSLSFYQGSPILSGSHNFLWHIEGVIELTGFSQQKIWVNQDLLKLVEATPDTVLCFLDGSKMLVLETPQEINEKIILYFKTIQDVGIKD